MKIVTLLPLYNHIDRKFYWKDIIQIWETFKKVKWFNFSFWSLNKQAKRLSVEGTQYEWSKNIISLLWKLITKSKEIDILHLYWIKRDTLFISIIYKFFNKTWFIYVKSDSSLLRNWIDTRTSLNIIPNIILRIFLKNINVLGLEDKTLLKYFKNRFPKFQNKFMFLPCWAVELENDELILKKENIITLCWRFGAKEKNFEIIIDMLLEENNDFLKNWNIQFIWEIHTNFQDKINHLLKLKPELKNKIILHWFIYDKKDLYKLLNKSKIFIITSLSEWEPNVQFDAMYCWNVMLSRDVWTIRQNYPEKFTIFFDDLWNLKSKLTNIIEKTNEMNISDYQWIKDICIKEFTWEKSLKPLLDKF